MTPFLKSFIVIILCIFLVSACTPSKDKAVRDTEKAVTTTLKSKPMKTNAEVKSFHYYKPDELSITQKGEHNIIFTDHDKNLYILFVNPNEKSDSQLNYKTAEKRKKSGDILKKYEIDHTFVYIYVNHIKDNNYEMVVDAGGVKMTTKTTLDNLADEAKMMAQVIHSVKGNKQ